MTTIIVRHRTDKQPTERPYLRRFQRISYAKAYSYRPLWSAEREHAAELEAPAARALLAWLRSSKFGAGYEYESPGLAEAPAISPREREKTRRQHLVLEALTQWSEINSGALADHCKLPRHEIRTILTYLKDTGAAERDGDLWHGQWRATKYGRWLVARRRLVAQIAGRPGWVVEEAPRV